MEPHADRRYQTPQEMLMDLKTLLQRMQVAGERAASIERKDPAAAVAAATPGGGSTSMGRPMPIDQKAVMVVESNLAAQDAFRTGLKRSGYRVLLTSDPYRAITRFEENERVADCVIFCSGDIGDSCLDAFNQFGQSETTRNVPALLLLGADQSSWKEQAVLAPHRLLLQMPVKFKDIRAALNQLLPGSKSGVSANTVQEPSTQVEFRPRNTQ
jgi:serine/threonine-protein kinase